MAADAWLFHAFSILFRIAPLHQFNRFFQGSMPSNSVSFWSVHLQGVWSVVFARWNVVSCFCINGTCINVRRLLELIPIRVTSSWTSEEGITKAVGGSPDVTHANAWEGQGSASLQPRCLTGRMALVEPQIASDSTV